MNRAATIIAIEAATHGQTAVTLATTTAPEDAGSGVVTFFS
jgi:acetylornithine/succinyldiaminopimelate/putrescine aminotransferase